MTTSEMNPSEAEAGRRRRRAAAVRPIEARNVQYGPYGREIVRSATEFRPEARGYGSAEVIRQSGRSIPRVASSDAHARGDLKLLRAESQRIDRDNCIGQAIVSRYIDVVLGTGSTLRAKPSKDPQAIEREFHWANYWRRPEVRRAFSGPELERIKLRHFIVDGDYLVIHDATTGLQQLIVADQIDTYRTTHNGNDIEQGVELDSMRRPVAYWVSPFDSFGSVQVSRARRIPAEQCCFYANRRRYDQTRGEPMGQAAFPMLHRINDVCDSEAAAWQLLSRFAVSIESENAPRSAFETSEADPELSGEEATRALANRVHDIGHALMFHGRPGESVKAIERNIPGQNFSESIKMFMRLLGMPFGMTLEFMLLIWSDTNYSSGRASIKQVERTTKPLRRVVEADNSDAYERQCRRWIADRRVSPPVGVEQYEWDFPPYPFIDPEKEASAQRERIGNGLSTMTREASAEGADYGELIAESSREIETAIVEANKLNARYPNAGISWRDFRPISEGSQTALVQATVGEPPSGGESAPEGGAG